MDVTVPLDNPSPTNWWQCYDYEGLGKAADYIAVMAYEDFDWEPLAAIDWVNGRVKALLAKVPADKVLLGVPFYGMDFWTGLKGGTILTSLPENLGSPDPPRAITPAVVQALLNKEYYTTSKGAKIEIAYWIEKGVWSDEYATTRYSFVDTDNNLHVLYCDDARSLRIKGGLTAFERLGGVAVWEIDYGTDDMWNALSEGMVSQ